ncbi:MAG TPA: RsmD family RNA methyltransferase [Opitutales bacterium]|nr:RsmD family RNA methyltransferase [Opitutales bacterium]
MRITGGIARGIELVTPKGPQTRPATDRMRQAIFSSLGVLVQEARCLDLFAGTGSYGLEALSRGAAWVSFVERDRETGGCLEKNWLRLAKCLGWEKAESYGKIFHQDALHWAPLVGEAPFELAFIDPPYVLWDEVGPASLRERLKAGLLNAQSLLPRTLVVEFPGKIEAPEFEGYEVIRRFGGKKGHEPCAAILKAI